VARVFTGLESPMHWLVLLVVCLVVFGPKRLPEIGRTLGKGIRELRAGVAGIADAPAADEPAPARGPSPAPVRQRSL
jgi:sec-independent protein translocase protein TatA